MLRTYDNLLSFLQLIDNYPYPNYYPALPLCYLQEEQMYALAADCSIGSAGSAILMTHSRSAQGEPALIYLKVRREERRGEAL